MSIAKKCNRCGNFYEMYNVNKSETNTNGIMLLNIDEAMKYFSHTVMDLCPDCMASFRKWLNAEQGE